MFNKITTFFAQRGNVAYNSLIGEVQLDRQGAKSLIDHLPRYVDKYATVEAIPQVINQGKLIRLEENWKNRGKDTCVITAPVEVGQSKKYMSVVLEQFTGRDGLTTRYHVHDLVILDNEKATSELHKTHISGTQDVVAYTYNILNNSKNNKYSIGLSSQDVKGRTLSKQQQEYFKDSKNLINTKT